MRSVWPAGLARTLGPIGSGILYTRVGNGASFVGVDRGAGRQRLALGVRATGGEPAKTSAKALMSSAAARAFQGSAIVAFATAPVSLIRYARALAGWV